MEAILRIEQLISELNGYRNRYYNHGDSSVSDAVYDRLFDELTTLEQKTGCVMSNSPTQTVGYRAVSSLPKTRHPSPLLSLEKTKSIEQLSGFCNDKTMLLMHKLDGLTVVLDYDNGKLMQAATRGDGEEGEIVTHNAVAIQGIPAELPYKGKLTVVGEAYILEHNFKWMKDKLRDGNGEPYKNSRNLAAGSIRCLDAAVCAERCLRFTPFSVLDGLDDLIIIDSKYVKLCALSQMGFDRCNMIYLDSTVSADMLTQCINQLKAAAQEQGIPIDGMVFTYNSISYSKSRGRTGHHFKDGLAFKFADDLFETVLRQVEWSTTRTGLISPVAIYDSTEIDGCDVSRATLHNITFIKERQLNIGCRILISKRNQIIPYVEENLDRTMGLLEIPTICPCCGSKTAIQLSEEKNKNGQQVETLWCENESCLSKHISALTHFVAKPAMNIDGLSEATLEKFVDRGWVKTVTDIYHLCEHKYDIIRMDGFGQKSYANLWTAIEVSRNVTFEHFLVAIDIPMVGKTASRTLAKHFCGEIAEFEKAISDHFDFKILDDFGDVLHGNIYAWFGKPENLTTWNNLKKEVRFISMQKETIVTENPFMGKTVVATGKLNHFTRSGIDMKIESLGAKAGSSVSAKTDYLIVGEKAGSKLDKARDLGVKTLTEAQFLEMAGA